MRICLDASVAVASERPKEPSHAASRARIDRILAGTDEIVVPALFPIEVAAALARVGVAEKDVIAYVDRLTAGAELVAIGPKRAPLIQAVALATKLRAADATYAWVAGREKVPLVTLDGEVLKRAASVCAVEPP
ncbi:MAG TPA: type II toxin-antitoxin system VapC family toxin [Labilithrix sp.]|nr:type II toxin-antitoxin system VapC family toxin [Labilithrix sp.]